MTALLFGTVSCKKSAGLSGAGPSSVGGSSGGTSSATNASGASTGTVFGGLSPINGATVSLYEAGTNTAIATTTTNAQGSFNLPFNGAAGLLYIVATGGNPGNGTNSSIQMISLVGSSSALPTSAVQVNELTTAAFMTVANNMGLINDSSGTVTFKAPNNTSTLNNAVTQINNFVSAGQLNTSNSNLTAASQQTLSTVADAIANCVEGGSSGCSTLMSTATNPSTSGSSSNILDATNNMLTTTSSSTISSIFSLAQTKAPTTGFALSGGAPSILTASLALSTAGPFSVGGTNIQGIAIDSSGNVWTSNYASNNVTELNSSGTTLGTFSATTPYFIAIDASGNVWVANNGGSNITELNSAGTTLGTFPVGTNPQAIAIDSSGSVWVTNSSSATVTKLDPNGNVLGTFTVGTSPGGIAIDTSGNVWVANNGSSNITELNSAGTTLGTFSVGASPTCVWIDPSGNIWVSTAASNTITKLSSTGTVLGTFDTRGNMGLLNPYTFSIDASGNIWVANDSGTSGTVELNSKGNVLGVYAPRSGFEAIDQQGNIWGKFSSGNIFKYVNATVGPQFFPYSGPQYAFGH